MVFKATDRSIRDGHLPYSIDPQQQTCKVCGRPMKLDFHVSDTVWRIVVPEEHRNHAVCLYCFDEYACQAGIGYSFVAGEDIWFCGKSIELRTMQEAKSLVKIVFPSSRLRKEALPHA